jgi:magnesium chelatase subunit H
MITTSYRLFVLFCLLYLYQEVYSWQKVSKTSIILSKRRYIRNSLTSLQSVQTPLDTEAEIKAAIADLSVSNKPGQWKSLLETRDAERNAIVLIAGFEKFNSELYKSAAKEMNTIYPDVAIYVFTDTDVVEYPDEVANAMRNARVLICSLIFDYSTIKWIKERLKSIPYRFCFESALELMSETQVDSFNMMSQEGKKAGPPAPVKAILQKFGSNREEDRMVGYLKLLKVGPKLLKFVPTGTNLGGIRTWITVYSYWTESGTENIISMFKTILTDCGFVSPKLTSVLENKLTAKTLKEYPSVGIFHPQLAEAGLQLTSPKQYLSWYLKTHPWVKEDTPRVGVLLYRKHVISEQSYIGNMITLMESNGILPIPVYINGVEGHTVVRDLFASRDELRALQHDLTYSSTLSSESVIIDAVVNTIGFPLVGGPAGSMEGGRNIDAAKEILQKKNIPYMVAAPLLIQGALTSSVLLLVYITLTLLLLDLNSWQKNGVQGLQTVVLYSLPELDGAIDTIILGGLVGEKIVVIPERVRKLCYRLKSWIALRQTSNYDRKIATLLYGFPPNVGSVGTAALLNVGQSLSNLFQKLLTEGFDIGDAASFDGESIIAALRYLYNEISISKSTAEIRKYIQSNILKQGSFEIVDENISYRDLKSWLGKESTAKMEKQWGELEVYSGIASTRVEGEVCLKIYGLKFGKFLLGLQPILGIEGDPMRLLFERDLTPHPQYAAYYQFLQRVYQPHVLLHYGMHGTVEWLPGSPLGNTAESWSDILLGNLPNVYVYACNNPSESILAKRRGYATILSHNVPPYSRSGLYKELSSLREILTDYRQSAGNEADQSTSQETILLIANLVNKLDLWKDCPFLPKIPDSDKLAYIESRLSDVEVINNFRGFVDRLWMYLLELENRLFSEGLHIMGRSYSVSEVQAYLDAVYGSSSSSATSDSDRKNKDQSLVMEAVAHAAYRHLGMDGFLDHIYNHQVSDEHQDMSYEAIYRNDLVSKRRFRELFNYLRLRTLTTIFNDDDAKEALYDQLLAELMNHHLPISLSSSISLTQVKESVKLAEAIVANSDEEINSLVRGLKGEYILPAPGGDIVRDGRGVLPTGRNIHALDPYRIPSDLALSRGRQAAQMIIDGHKNQTGKYPETVSVNLWGLDTIKTKGESIGIVLGLVGAEPVREATGRIVAFQLLSLQELGRPRIDVLGSVSGIFRDALANVCDLLDDLFYQAATAENEPVSMNYIKLHAQSMTNQGIDRSYSRLFSNPPGDFGSMVNEQIGSGEWEDSKELGNTWISRNSYSYGKATEKGVARDDVLRSLLNSTERVIQQIDSVEYGLTDIQEYFANTGALKRAAESVQGDTRRVNVSVIEAFEKQVRPKDLESVLRMEYRTKLLNPKWSAAMLKQGSGGAYEISGRMTSLIGWAGTTGFQDQWVFDGVAETYVLDAEVAKQLREQNPEAFRNIVKRM